MSSWFRGFRDFPGFLGFRDLRGFRVFRDVFTWGLDPLNQPSSDIECLYKTPECRLSTLTLAYDECIRIIGKTEIWKCIKNNIKIQKIKNVLKKLGTNERHFCIFLVVFDIFPYF